MDKDDRPLPDRIADLLLSGLTGMHLVRALRQQFGTAKRDDVFMGIAMAISIYEADVTIAETELRIANTITLMKAPVQNPPEPGK